MKLVSHKGDRLVFKLDERERDLFLVTLSYYPLLNADYHRLTKNLDSGPLAEEQQLLREAMEEQRRNHKKQLNEFVDGMKWEADDKGVFKLSLTIGEAEWILTLLNDVRVGSWDILGRPDYAKIKKLDQQSQNSHYYALMEMSGFFQSVFLQALQGSSSH